MTSHLTPKYVVHPVGGQDKRFYPVSVSKAFKLRRVAEPAARALSALFADRNSDMGHKRTQIENPSEGVINEIIIEPINPELARLRSEQQERGIQQLLEALVDNETALLLAELIQNSLREEKEVSGPDSPPPAELLESWDLVEFGEMIHGLVKANAKVLGPFQKVFDQRFRAALDEGLKATAAPVEETAGQS